MIFNIVEDVSERLRNHWVSKNMGDCMRHDLLADVMSIINNAEKEGKESCSVPSSKLVEKIINVMQEKGYIGNVESENGRLKLELKGKINCSRALRPRFPVKTHEFEKWERRYLPAKGFGLIIVSTSEGVMSQKEAIEKNIGGRLLAFVY